MIRLPASSVGSSLQALATLAALSVLPASVQANVTLPNLFSDHMVLQRDAPIRVWGWADPGEDVTVTFGGKSVPTKADKEGNWKAILDQTGANATPQTLVVAGKNSVQFQDVVVGDVWVCSGQSNMELYFGETAYAATDGPAAQDPLLRFFRVSGHSAIAPEKNALLWNRKQWLPCVPQEVDHFTAVGYYFGRELRRALNIPIGLISAAQGGSKAQLWISPDTIEKNVGADPQFKEWLDKRNQVIAAYPEREAAYVLQKKNYDDELKRWKNEVDNDPAFVAKKSAWEAENSQALAEGKTPPPRPQPATPKPTLPDGPDDGPHSAFMVGNLYHSMIAPLIPLSIKGVIWYQGESNSDNGKQYGVLFPLLIQDWREKWACGEFPFLFVQLPNIGKPATQPVQEGDRWPLIREVQSQALSLPNTGMAITIDVGDPYNVHGKDKLDPGVRLAKVARHLVYGEEIVYTGPTYDSMKASGGKITITFKNTGKGLSIGVPPWTPSGKIPPVAEELKGFAIAGADKQWAFAKAQIEGNSVVVSSEQVPQSVAVRYGWANNPPCNLYNSEHLPAAPFRTDNW